MNGRTYSEALRTLAPLIAEHRRGALILRTLADAERETPDGADGFDTADAVYWHAYGWHAGQGCLWYRVLSALSGRLRFSPSILATGPDTAAAIELAGALHAIECIGEPVSVGTLWPGDLIPRFLALLDAIDPDAARAYTAPASGHAMVPASAFEDDAHGFWRSIDADAVLALLLRELERRAPAGCYFGAPGRSDRHARNSQAFGFWEIDS